MKQSLIGTIVIAAVMVGEAAAQDGAVTVYGRLNMTLDYASARDATRVAPGTLPTQMSGSLYARADDGSVNRVSSNSSNVGFRGREPLGGGLSVVWQIESSVSADTGGGTIAGRNSFVGLDGRYGYLILGNHDTPYKLATVRLAPFYAPTSFDYFNILGNPGFGVPVTASTGSPANNAADANFDRRAGNSVQYRTPAWNGLQLLLHASTGELSDRDAYLWSTAITYANGPLQVRYAYERHDDYFGLGALGGARLVAGNRSSRDDGHKLVVEYTLNQTTLSGAVERLQYRNDDSVAGRVNRYKRDAWWLQVGHSIGAGTIYAAFGKAADGSCGIVGGGFCGTDGLGARQIGVGYGHPLSRRTAVFAYFTEVKNEESGQYSIVQPVNLSPGVTTRIASIGINHRF